MLPSLKSFDKVFQFRSIVDSEKNMLKHTEIASYLLEKQWLSSSSLIQDQIEIVNLSRRNWNYKVVSTDSPSFFLKLGNGEVGLGTVDHEAMIYEFLQQESCHKVKDYLPHYLGFEKNQQILTLEYLHDAQDLRTYQVKRGNFPDYIATQIGKILALLHDQSSSWKSIDSKHYREDISSMPEFEPWILNAHQPQITVLRTVSEATLDLMKMIQKFPAFGDRFASLSQNWKRTSLIHGDIKFENFIAYRSPKSKRKAEIKLLDWEFASIGDPCWDIGSVFSAYLKLWIFSIPITGEVPPNQFAKLAEFPLEKMHRAINAFWRSYSKQMKLDSVTDDEYLLRSVQLSAARLVQTALELTDLGRLTSTVVCLMQLSLNILQKPEQATTQLLGIQRGIL